MYKSRIISGSLVPENPDCRVISVVAGDFADLAKGKESAPAIIEQGADIVFQIAGLTGLGVINACKEKNVLALGVDVDMFEQAPGTILLSAEKKLTRAAYLVIERALNGTFRGGDNIVFGLTEGATGISPFHNFDGIIPQEVRDAVKKAEEDMKSGKIKIPASRKEAGYEG